MHVQSFVGHGGKFEPYTPFDRKPVELFELFLAKKGQKYPKHAISNEKKIWSGTSPLPRPLSLTTKLSGSARPSPQNSRFTPLESFQTLHIKKQNFFSSRICSSLARFSSKIYIYIILRKLNSLHSLKAFLRINNDPIIT